MKLGEHLGNGWGIVKENLVPFAVGLLLTSLIGSTIILAGPMYVGMFTMCLKAARKEKVEIGDVFAGFQNIGDGIILGLILVVGASVASITVVGGLLAAGFMWSFLFMADKKMGWQAALNANVEMLKKDWVNGLIFPLICVIIGELGVLACCVGIFVSMPVALVAITLSYLELQGGGKSAGATPA